MSANDIFSAEGAVRSARHQQRIERNIAAVTARRVMRPAYTPQSDEATASNALAMAKAEEGIFEWLHQSLSGGHKRKETATQIVETLRKQELAAYNEAVTSHSVSEQLIDSELQRLANELEQVSATVCQELMEHLAPVQPYAPTNDDKKRLIRAVWLGILTAEGAPTPHLQTDEFIVTKRAVLQEDRYRCLLCEKKSQDRGLHVHHIIHLAHGGTNSERNLVTLCIPCHAKQHPDIRITGSKPKRKTNKA